MNNSRVFTLLGIIIVAVIVIWNSVFIVYPREQVVIKRFGEITRVAPNPGLYFKVPFVDQMVRINNRLLLYDMPTESVQVRGGSYFDVDAFFIYRVTDPKLFLEKIGSGNPTIAADNNLGPRFVTALRAVYGKSEYDAALSGARGAMMGEIQKQLSAEAKDLGINIIDVRIRKTDLTESVSEDVYRRMTAERLTFAEKTIAEGQQEKERIVAQANREAQVIVASAQKDAQQIIGQGEAERIRIIQEASEVDPSFYTFWEAMESYKMLKDTPMVISPNWSFFNYIAANPIGKTQPKMQSVQ